MTPAHLAPPAPRPTFRCLSASPAAEEPELGLHPPMDLRLESAACDLAIRVPDPPRRVRCDACGTEFLAAGPTGFDDDEPVCDRCLVGMAPQLGMVLALVSVTRSFGQLGRDAGESAAAELVAFSRVYESFAARHAPRREPVLGPTRELPS